MQFEDITRGPADKPGGGKSELTDERKKDRVLHLPAERFRMQGEPDERELDEALIPAIKAIRSRGLETIASNSAIGGVGKSWGSYIQIQLIFKDIEISHAVAKEIAAFANELTVDLQRELNNPALALQFVSADRWYEDPNTTSLEIIRNEVYRLQLVGYKSDEEIRYAWNKVDEKFPRSVIGDVVQK